MFNLVLLFGRSEVDPELLNTSRLPICTVKWFHSANWVDRAAIYQINSSYSIKFVKCFACHSGLKVLQ